MNKDRKLNTSINKGLVSGVMLIALSACATVGPDYLRPEAKMPAKWSVEGRTAGRMDVKSLAQWWSALNDPALTSLVERAVLGNLDLLEAKARVREARARKGVSEANRLPTVDAEGSAGLNRTSGDGAEREFYRTGFDAGWELDLFGGKRRTAEAARADLEASEEDLRDVLVTLTGEVALNYVEVRSFQARLKIAEANRNAQQETYQITLWRFEAGLTTELDVEQAKSNLENTRAQIPALQTGLEQTENRIAVLLGIHPGFLKEELSEQKPVPTAPLEITVGVPADVLRNRPDVRRAERQLAAQTARIGVATAELYPKFSLTGSIGLEALSLENLLKTGSRTYGLSLPFAWNVFDAGRVRQNIEVQNALQEQTLIRYEAAILLALEEVENALIAYAKEQVRRQSLTEASQAAGRAVTLAQNQYSSGLIDFQTVLDAQRTLLLLQDQLALSEARVTSNLISLYKSLGGGWTSTTSETGGASIK